MPLNPGTRLGSYEVTAQIGAGGMGEVYRATDTTLGRSVAIKVLPGSLASDPERLARFEREARTLASLNHPNIAQVYGFENANGVRALVMELVEGPTLADRITEGPVPVDEALAIARQIATALEVAHDAGIIHRDLKPANVKLRPDGTVKVLDFGLAKAMEPAGVTSSDAMSPTITSPALMTGVGVLLGTAAYMAPEQARGKRIDARADIWAFGVVVYEMLTGRRLFDGETMVDVLGQVVHKEADLQQVPERLRRLLRRCLEKDPNKRLRHISGVELLLEEPAASAPTRSRLAVAASIAAGALAVALAVVTWALWPEPPIVEPPARFSIGAPPETEFTYIFPGAAISPDGRLLVFTAQRGGQPKLWLRALDSLQARELPGTDAANFPFWSSDGQSVAFWSSSERSLKRTEALGGAPHTLCEAQGFEGGAWNQDGVILFSSSGALRQVRAGGGSCAAVTTREPGSGERHTWPHFLPDGRTFLFVIRSTDPKVEGVYASSLDRPEQRTKLLNTDTKALYAPPYGGHPGFLLWLRDSTLVAQRFDPGALIPEGEPISIAEQIRVGGGNTSGVSANRAAFWVSENGRLVYRTGDGAGRELTWVGRDNKRLDTILEEERDSELTNTLRLSRDRNQLAAERTVGEVTDIWAFDIARALWRKVTDTPGRDGNPVWSPDGRQIAFSSERDGSTQIYSIDANGAGQERRLTNGPNAKLPRDWSQDGRYLIYAENHPENQRDLWILPLDPNGLPGKPIPFLTTRDDEPNARFSRDGRWIAYTSTTTGRSEASIRAFPGTGAPNEYRVSGGGATTLVWHDDGSVLFYRSPNPAGGGQVIAVPVRLLPDRVEIGTAQTLFSNQFNDTGNVSADGQRFLFFTRAGETSENDSNPLTVLLNWQAALK